ncbi:N-terminal Xaa-Pro-Lys N-methyltransferase 1 isoform X1 [Eptesicus fuscus]|uniref:N-terminal Xaa-Pro-Lys N-methyltransferase 1 isoform X1 n=1 Tax=Eptesicus fuscus TaxID=29078 RepID=UPI002403E348|nr:N-terminal Xaa-Pro-Lys N-methyltransferase 1 isoform X1 [Eptesicus fuscus]
MALPCTASDSSNSTLFHGSREREVAGAAIQEVPLRSLSRRGWRQHDERGDRRREAILLQGQDVLEGHPADGGRHARGEGPNQTGTSCALDCGAGIGRITKRLLLPLFRAVDLVDVTEDFLAKAKTYLGEEGKRVRNYFCCGLQDFSPEPSSYDVIWIQWVIGHLTDRHLAEFLRRCKRGLRPNGIIVIKDNMAQEGVILDDVDSSVCRDLEVVHGIVRSAGLSLLAQERQENLPDEIYHVYSLALR